MDLIKLDPRVYTIETRGPRKSMDVLPLSSLLIFVSVARKRFISEEYFIGIVI